MAIVTVGMGPAKNVFAVHSVDESGNPALVRPGVPHAKLIELVANLAPCLVGMEACSGAHHWAREFAKFGHTALAVARGAFLGAQSQDNVLTSGADDEKLPYSKWFLHSLNE